MSGPLTTHAFQGLIDEDIAWLIPRIGESLEGKHVLEVLRWVRENRELVDGQLEGEVAGPTFEIGPGDDDVSPGQPPKPLVMLRQCSSDADDVVLVVVDEKGDQVSVSVTPEIRGVLRCL